MKDMKVAGSLICFVFVASHAGTTEEGEMDPLDAGDGGWYPALMRNAWRYRYGVDKGAIYPSPSGKGGGGPFRN